MGKKLEVKSGDRYWRLTIIEEVEPYIYSSGYKERMVKCRCDCGNPTIVRLKDLRSGKTQSCGCLQFKTNKYDLSGEYGIGYTSNTNEPFYFDLEDFDKIKNYCWAEHKLSDSGYKALETVVNKKTVRFHYLLDKKGWDHINRNPFDNRKSNLRKTTPEGNARNHTIRKDNTSGTSGVYYLEKTGKWKAGIGLNGKMKHLGVFDTYEEAVEARVKAEKEHYGEWSPLHKKEECC